MSFKRAMIMLSIAFVFVSCVNQKKTTNIKKINSLIPWDSGCFYTEGYVEKGQDPGTIIGSTLLTEEGEVENGALHVRFNGTIGAVGDFDKIKNDYRNAAILDCRKTTVLSPGWVNAHEHIAYSYDYPDPDLHPVYRHRDEWRLGLNSMKKLSTPKSYYYYKEGNTPQSNSKLIWVELRHLLSGTTVIGGAGGVPGVVKNINIHIYNTDPLIYPVEADMKTFPFSFNAIIAFKPLCDGLNVAPPSLRIDKNLLGIAYVPHIGEGVRANCTAKLEIEQYLKYIKNNPKKGRRFSLVQGISASGVDFNELSEMDVTLIWSPRSNLAFYGQTIELKSAMNYGVRIALGSDWSLSGSFDMLQEIICADRVSKLNGSILTDKDLWRMATCNASYALGLERVTGSLRSGLQADFFLAKRKPGSAYSSAIRANKDDIIGVWVDGKPLVLSPDLLIKLGKSEKCTFVEKLNMAICIDLNRYKLDWHTLKENNIHSIPLIGDYECQEECETK
ncbi:MAG: amidohydrolase family protein [Desulfobacteraceae bacterium]|nr:amidohydrolase family protein [Desulfobacteraceae bacterium]